MKIWRESTLADIIHKVLLCKNENGGNVRKAIMRGLPSLLQCGFSRQNNLIAYCQHMTKSTQQWPEHSRSCRIYVPELRNDISGCSLPCLFPRSATQGKGAGILWLARVLGHFQDLQTCLFTGMVGNKRPCYSEPRQDKSKHHRLVQAFNKPERLWPAESMVCGRPANGHEPADQLPVTASFPNTD